MTDIAPNSVAASLRLILREIEANPDGEVDFIFAYIDKENDQHIEAFSCYREPYRLQGIMMGLISQLNGFINEKNKNDGNNMA